LSSSTVLDKLGYTARLDGVSFADVRLQRAVRTAAGQ